MTILYQRALLLARLESTFDEDAVPDAPNDAFLVIDPQFTPDISILERNNTRISLSRDAPIAGRQLGSITFQHEVRSNGNTNGTVEPKLGRLLKACGMGVTQINTAAETLFDTDSATGNVDGAVFTVTTAFSQGIRRRLRIEVVDLTPIAVRITAPAEAELAAIDTGTADVTIANGVEFDVFDDEGNFIVGITPDFGTDAQLTVGSVWELGLRPLGYEYRPISDNFPSLTLYLYYPDDTGVALLHKLTGARGTWSLAATGGQFGTFTFTFTGSYNDTTDSAYPTNAIYEQIKPPQVELAALKVRQNDIEVTELCASQWTIDIANDIQPRDCVNSPNSYKGSLIVGRNPVLGMDPESTLEAVHPFWENLANAESVEWSAKIGTVKGNIVSFYGPNVVYSSLAYQDRNSIRAYNLQAAFAAASGAGNDELVVGFA